MNGCKAKDCKERKQYDEQTEVNMLRKMVKEREETAKIYFENNRHKLAEAEITQSVFIKELLPEDVSEDTINEYIDKEFPVFTDIGKSDIGNNTSVGCILNVLFSLSNAL